MKKTTNKLTVIGIILTTIILAGVAIFTSLRLYQTRDTAVAPNVPSSRPNAAGQSCDPRSKVLQCGKDETCVQTGSDPAVGTCQVSTRNACYLEFTIATPTATPTKTPTPTPVKTSTPTATATPVPQCNSTCNSTSDCPSNLTCYKPNGATAGNCRNAACTTASNCFCATATPTATATATSTSVATVTPTATSAPQCNYTCTSNSNCPSSMICYIPSGQTSGNCRNTACLGESDCICPNPTATATNVPQLPEVGTKWPTIVGTGFGILVILGSLFLAL